jgi:DnaJ-class molecular chaperone
MIIRVAYIDYFCNNRYLVSMEGDDSIQCPVCNGEGFDLDGFVCWKCKGDGQITHGSTSKNSIDTNINKSTR